MHMHLGSIKAFQGNKRIYEIVEVVFLLDPLMPNSPVTGYAPWIPNLYSIWYIVTPQNIVL